MTKVKTYAKIGIVAHELGHLFTLILFSNLGLSNRKIELMRFFTSWGGGLVKSAAEIEGLKIDSTCEEIKKIQIYILPSLINFLAGYAMESIFDSSKPFKEGYYSHGAVEMNKDYQNVNSLRSALMSHLLTTEPIENNNCINLGKEYIVFLRSNFYEELEVLVNFILELDVSDIYNIDKGEITFEAKRLEEIIKKIESKITPKLLEAADKWFKNITDKYKLQFNNSPVVFLPIKVHK